MLEYDVVAKRIDAHGSSARCKDAEIVLDTDVNGRAAGLGIFRLLLVVPFVMVAPSAIGETSGEMLFEKKCEGCHSEARVVRKLRAISEGERISYLERLLPGHYAANASERQFIIEYLVAKAGK